MKFAGTMQPAERVLDILDNGVKGWLRLVR